MNYNEQVNLKLQHVSWPFKISTVNRKCWNSQAKKWEYMGKKNGHRNFYKKMISLHNINSNLLWNIVHSFYRLFSLAILRRTQFPIKFLFPVISLTHYSKHCLFQDGILQFPTLPIWWAVTKISSCHENAISRKEVLLAIFSLCFICQ